MSEVFDKVIASLGKIPSPFEVGRKLGLNIPTGEDITGEDIKNILSIIGPQADIKAMVEESSRIVPALKKGDIPEALSGLVLSALAPFMLGIPGTVSGIRKGSEGLSKELVRNVSKSLRHPVGGEYKHIPTRTREIGLESLREPTIESIETGTLHHMDDRWLRNKIKKAREDRAIELKRQRKAVKETPDYTSQPSYTSTIGSSEGVTASISKMNINPKRLENMPGAMGEEILRKEGFKLDNLLKSISKEGYDPTKGRILIHVREDGQPFIVEGNHRLAAALLTKQSSIPVEIKYLRGSESIVGPLNPKRLASLGEQSKSTGGLSGLGESRKIKAKPKQKKPDVENLGKELSDAQMIGPERTMPHVLNAMHESDAGYAAGYLVEHIGDLTRKMGDGVGVLGPVKLRDIKEKVGKGLRKLRYGNVEGEFNESMKGKNVKKLNKLFEKYADEHSKLPIFNKPQWLAREAAVSVGKKDFNRTRELLEELEILIDNPNNFYKLNSSIDPTFSSHVKDTLLKEVKRKPDFKGHAEDVYWTKDPITLKHIFNPDEDYAASIVATARHGPFETVDPVSPRILKSTKKQIYEATQKALENFPDKIKVYRMAEKDAPFNLEGVDSFTLDPKFSGSTLPWAVEKPFGPLKKNYQLTEYLVDKKDILAAPNALWKGSGVFDEQEVILRTAKLKGSGGLSGLGEK